MNQLVPFAASHDLPPLLTNAGSRAQDRFFEFFTANKGLRLG
jgi:hypothetical protein